MKYIIAFLTIMLFTLSSFAQEFSVKTINLKWEDKTLINAEKDNTWYMPTVLNNHGDFEKMIPNFIEKWEVPNASEVVSFEISNVRYKSISKTALHQVKLANVPSDLHAEFFVRSTRYKSHAFIQIVPLVKEGNTYKKVTSFTLRYKLKTKALTKGVKTVSNSVLASGTWYKFSVDTTGVYKIDKNFLKNLGLDIDKINPQNISIYGNGGQMLPYKIGDFRHEDLAENAIYIEGEADGSFDANDFILFYAKGADDWTHNNTSHSVAHRKNSYSDFAYYFINVGSSAGKRIENMLSITGVPIQEITTYDDYIVHEFDKKNIAKMGRLWVGEPFHIENVQHFYMNFDNLDTETPLRIKTQAVAVSSATTSMTVEVNNQDLYSFSIAALIDHTLARVSSRNTSIDVDSGALDFKLTYTANPSAKAYLDYIEVIGKKHLIANDKQFSFRNFDAIGVLSSYSIQNPTNIYQVWNVTDPTTAMNVVNQDSGANFSFVENNTVLQEYIVLNNTNYYTPTLLANSSVANQNLHALENVDYVIITRDDFVDEAEVLANYHRENSDLNVKVVPLYQIYNEFGSGAADITAIRDFVKYLYDNSAPLLQYVLLYGDTSFDYKNIEGKGENIVPTYEYYNSFHETNSFVTDDYFAIVSDDNEGDIEGHEQSNTQDIAISRIPVRTELAAAEVTAKLLRYYSEDSFGDWRNQLVLMADDIDDIGWENSFQEHLEGLADVIKEEKPLFNIKKLYADAFPQVLSANGASYPAVNTALNNSVESGVLMMDYYGHGGEDGLALERILTNDQVRAWNNIDNLPLFMVISCEFARFDNPNRPNTGGELTIRNTHGGVAHQIAAARAMTTGITASLNTALVTRMLEINHEPNSIAENLRLAKNIHTAGQRFFVMSFGDPAMKLAIPRPKVKLTHMNGVPVSQSLDTIKALSHVYFDGVVAKINGDTDTDFNGTMSVVVYDKSFDKQTLQNGVAADLPPMLFDVQDSKIFRGQATVTNGVFSFDFVAPLDIKIAYGKGKLSFYADNSLLDKGGYNLDVTVGGVNQEASEDNKGPKIRLYMNDESFIDGGTTNQSPLFLAFFEDENGINTSLSAVDHDIVLTLDDDHLNTIVLNDYYNTALDDFTKGNLEYRLRNLEVGQHNIHLKAYDTYNNKSEATLNFVVLDDGELILSHVLNYPNPFVNYTEFWFNHNKPNEPLEVQLQIFTVSGKLVKTINQLVQNTGGLSRELKWNGLDDFGQKIGKGVYVYKLSVKATISGLYAEKYEKLVILQ